MSYILDALRKSEDRRKQNHDTQTPLRTTRIGKQSSRTHKKRLGGLILTGCILLAVILLGAGWWFAQDGSDPVGSTKETATGVITRETTEVITGVTTEVTTPANIQSTKEIHSNETVQQSPETLIEKSFIGESPLVGNEEKLSTRTDEIVYVNDLAPGLQAQISDMKFSGHVYSPTPALRMIMIDNAVAREGDIISSDLTLVEITENGLIMQTGTTRFQMDLF